TTLAIKKLEDNGFKLTESNDHDISVIHAIQIKRTVNQSYSISDHNVNFKTMVLDKYMLVPKGEYKKLVSQKDINQLRQNLSQAKEEMQILQTKLHKDVLYNPDDFITMLNNYNLNLKSFFNAMVEMTSPKEKNSDVNKHRIIDAGISLMTMELLKQGIDALATLGITASYRVIVAKRCKLLKAQDQISKYIFKI
ncbi:5020_t:CDS:2, partial [Cetraspora pellucida]